MGITARRWRAMKVSASQTVATESHRRALRPIRKGGRNGHHALTVNDDITFDSTL